jgi:hypothetical protein
MAPLRLSRKSKVANVYLATEATHAIKTCTAAAYPLLNQEYTKIILELHVERIFGGLTR